MHLMNLNKTVLSITSPFKGFVKKHISIRTKRLSFSKLTKLSVIFTILFSITATQTAHAIRGIIRDAETENLINDYAQPIFEVANVGSQNIKIHIIGDRRFNAFVIDGQNMFIHVGALMKTKTPNQLIGIIAHETGHIAGGHLAGLRRKISKSQGTALVCQVLGILATTAAAATGQSGSITSLGTAAIGGCGNLLQRSILSYRRAHESAADQAAIAYLEATKQSGLGMLETFEFFADQGLASLKYVDPYVQSHPMPRDRIAQLRNLVENSSYYDKEDSPKLQLRHDLMRAKIIGFMNNPLSVFRQYPASDQSLPGQYARAIAYYHQGNLKKSIQGLNKLIAQQPKNPYFYEAKGQFLFEKGQARASIPSLTKALSLAPKENLIRILLSEALLATGDKKYVNQVIKHLKIALVHENTSAHGYRLLAQAYGQKGLIPQARLASAHRYLYEGKINDAKTQAKWAKKQFKRGTAAWLQADDIINYQSPR